MAAIRSRFSMIDVVKTQLELKKGGKSKPITLTNEVKIITSSDETFELWKEVISCAARGDLIDVDSKDLSKFKDKKDFEPEKDGVLNREFFKFLGNLSEADHAKMCRHMLCKSGPSRKHKHPKVVQKQPTSVVEDCYSVKDWVERRKRKATARFQLHLIRPDLGLFVDNDKHFVEAAWKKFKQDFHVSKASKRVLLDWGLPDLYYQNQRATMHRNTPCEDLSPYAKQFFTVFLQKRLQFLPPTGAMYYRAFKDNPITFGTWPSDIWHTQGRNANFGIIDFRFVPGVTGKARSSVQKPFFEEFMNLISSKGQPVLTELPSWLFICGDVVALEQLEAFAKKAPLVGTFDLFPSEYVPAPNERLGGYSAKSKLAMENVRLLFLIKKDQPIIPRTRKLYKAPEHVVYERARMYKEMEYAMYPLELRMEFYVKMLDLFCKPGESIVQIFAGTKLLTASVVSLLPV